MAGDGLDARLPPPRDESARSPPECAVGRHMRGLCVKTWTALPPISSTRSIAFEMPPAAETWAPKSMRLRYFAHVRPRSHGAVAHRAPPHRRCAHLPLQLALRARPGRASACCGSRTPTRAARSRSRSSRSSARCAGSASSGTARRRSSSTSWSARRRKRNGSSRRERPTRTTARSAFACPTTGSTGWDDAIKGRIEVPNAELEDVVLVRSDGRPTYNFASPLEDWLDGITHVIRGDDHVSNTPKQIDVLRALGAEPPVYAHVPSVFGADGKQALEASRSRVGRRVPRGGLRPRGAHELPRAARLGAGRRDDDHVARRARRALLARARRLEPRDVRLREARLDERRCTCAHSRPTSTRRGSSPISASRDATGRRSAFAPPRRSCRRRSAASTSSPGFAGLPVPRRRAGPGAARRAHPRARRPKALARCDPWTTEPIEGALKQLCDELGEKPRTVYLPIRVAVTGSRVSPGLYESLELLGRETVARSVCARSGRGRG